MGLPLFQERRQNQRKKLTGLLPGKMIRIQKDSNLTCRPVDISEHGLGIITTEQIAVGERLQLTIGDTHIEFEVLWAKPDFGKSDRHRFGLELTSRDINLITIFEKSKCLV